MRNQNDFEIGYNYARKHYAFLAKYEPQYLWELGAAYLMGKGPTAELSRGMGLYYLELGMKLFLSGNSNEATGPKPSLSARP